MPAEYRPMALLLAFIFWTCGAAGAVADENVCAQSAAGKVVAVKGRVELATNNSADWRSVKPGSFFCYGQSLRTGRDGLVAVWLIQEKTMVRLNASSTIIYREAKKSRPLLELVRGAAYLFSRTPQQLDIKTPHINGGIEGTEFLLYVNDPGDRSVVQVFEGVVSAQNGRSTQPLFAAQGEIVTASATTGPRRLSADDPNDVALWRGLVDPLDGVQWTLYYPVLSDAGSQLQASIERGDLENARALIAAQPDTEETRATRIIIGIVQARRSEDRALVFDDAKDAAKDYPQSEMVALAYSYAQQSIGEVEAALARLEQFAVANPTTMLTTLRLAELALINGDARKATLLAKQAITNRDTAARAHTILGFAFLEKLALKNAQGSFITAIDLNSNDPAPRFGLGLTKIRRGDVEGGREEIEFAASLDPNVSLYRSYLGQAYFEEGRTDKSRSQYGLAKERDPDDPTPWLFESVQDFLGNQPIAALKSLMESIKRNNNRAVYRSDSALADDLAVRGSVLSGIFRTLGLEEFGIPEASRAIFVAPTDHAGYRFLADLYADQPFQDYARASEILRAQTLQPLTLDPVRPQLAETDLTFLGGAGFNGVSFNEFTAAFETNGHRLTFAGLGGNFGTAANEFLLSGLQGKVAYNISQFHYETDGVRDNNDVRHDVVSAFVQGEVSPSVRLQAEFRYRNTDQGDLTLNFDPDDFSRVNREEITSVGGRVSGRFDLNSANTLIANFGYREFENQATAETSAAVANIDLDIDGFNALFQHTFSKERLSVISGFELQEDEIRFDTLIDISKSFGGTCPAVITSCVTTSTTVLDRRRVNVYSYLYLTPKVGTQITLGISHDDLNAQAISFDELQPKIGLTQEITDWITIRVAYTQSVGTDPETPLSLQPTQVAGFAQNFDDGIASTNEQLAGAVEVHFSDQLLGQLRASWRETRFRVGDLANSFRTETDSDILSVGGSVNAFFGDDLQFNVAPDYSEINVSTAFQSPLRPNFPDKIRTTKVPISTSFYSDWGTRFRLIGTFVHQELEVGPIGTLTDTDENFFTVDLEVAHRFLEGRGEIALGVTNLFGANFRYQELNTLLGDTSNPEFIDDTLVTFSGTVRF